ncbi:unnamed protein product [Nezara viridula]|uniref:FAM194 C-terminal domain-containing protein n=1 Tax=Nezara viridula TaxID=85310 RepID=A0A9P0MSR6_NEZVI|nr:unnamed protein product [Nezara viridula]
MTSKVSTKCNKASTLIITNYDDNKTEKKKKGFSENFAKDYITKSVRETRYFEMIQNMSATTKVAPLYLGSQSYQELFKKLIESCRSFFTKEYGKSEEDYNMFVENCTKTYEIPKRHERSLVFERMRLYKYDTEYGKKDTASVVSMKKSKTSIVPRHKSKGECMKNRSRQVSACKRSKSLYKRMKKSKKADAYGTVFERSASDLIDSSEEEQRRGSIKDAPKKLKPFVYKLSDPEMIKNGITVNYQLPKRLVTFVAHPACRHTFWFQTRIEPLEKYYPNGNISWRHDTDGTATVYYENGEPAISFIYGRIGPLIIVYTKSEKIRDRIIKQVPVALFDTRGNGVVYNKKTGKKRLLYDQAQGILLDTPSKCPISWKWKCYNQVQCRRAELNFVSPTHLDDYDFGKRKTRITKNIENLQRKSKKRRITSIWEPRKSRFRKKSRRTEYLNMLKYKRRYTSKMASSKSELSCASIKKKFSMNNSILRDIDVPKVIRFVGRKIVIKPIFTPCSEIEAIITNVASSPSHRTLFDSAAASAKISSKPTSRGKIYIKTSFLILRKCLSLLVEVNYSIKTSFDKLWKG